MTTFETPVVLADGSELVVASGATVVVGGGNTVVVPRSDSTPERFTIDLLADGVKVAEAPAAVFDGVIRSLKVGEWRCEGAVSGLDTAAAFDLDTVDAVRVVREADRRIVFSGFATPVDDGTGGLEVDGVDDGERFVLAGPDAWFPLTARVAYPDPSTEAPWSLSHDERSGVASTVAAAYVAANLGDGALAARRWGDVDITDGETGLSGSWSARLQRLDLLIARVCSDGGILCRPTITFAGAVAVWLGGPRDRSATIVLSDQGDLVNLKRRRVAARKTHVIAGGQGNLTARTFRQSSSGETGDDRVEAFADWSSLATAAEVQQAANTTRAQAAATWSVSADLSDVAAQRLRFLTDYDIGDLVAVEINNVRHSVPIDAVRIELVPDRQVIRPILGTAAPNALAGLVRTVASLSQFAESTVA